jgi:hypothetical protein
MVKALRVTLLLAVLLAGAWVSAQCRRAARWGVPDVSVPARQQRQEEVLQDYAREMDAIFERHGRVMTPECAAEQEALRRATLEKLEALRREGR